jgi:flagellar motor switch protein FliM
MNKILSQDEVDALLRGVSSGDIETGAGKGSDASGVKSYDLRSQERIVRGRMPGLEIANERFARYFRNSLSTHIMRFADVNVHATGIVKFGEFMKTVPVPSSINIFKMEPLKGYALLVFEAPLVFALMEYFFGGTNKSHTKTEGRSFTAIEQRIIKKLTGTVLNDFATAWQGIAQLRPEHVSSEMNPQFVTIVTPSEIVIRIEVHVEVENFTGKLFLCIPYSLVEPVKEKLYSGIQADKFDLDQRWVAQLKGLLTDSVVEIVAEMGRAMISVGELMNLKKGDIIPLGTSVSDELLIKVEKVPKLRGTPGISRGSQAVKITRAY